MAELRTIYILGATALLTSSACGDPVEAPRVELPVIVDSSGVVPVTTDLGYSVEVTEARVAISDLVFTVAGEADVASLWRRLSDALVPRAWAHPGHFSGGEVTGELRGDFLVDWGTGNNPELGRATLIAGTYTAANFIFDRGSSGSLDASDVLVGRTAVFSGTAQKDGQTFNFTIVVESPEGRVLIGVPFEASVGEAAAGTLRLRLETQDPFESDTLFDGLDFASLDGDGDGQVRVEPGSAEVEDAYNAFRREFQTHDYYTVRHEE